MARQPDEHITFPESPEAITDIRRPNSFLRSAVCGALIAAGVLAVGANAFPAPSLPDDAFNCFGPNQPVRLTESDVAARLRAIQDLIALEVEIRARLPRAQPGVIIPNEGQETFR